MIFIIGGREQGKTAYAMKLWEKHTLERRKTKDLSTVLNRSKNPEACRVTVRISDGRLETDEQTIMQADLITHFELFVRREMEAGRDTKPLSEAGIARAAVETVAENASDGVIAPLFYLAIGGPFLGWLYKAVNTMDSMVGYKNDRYLHFGRAAAKLDDLVNLIPSRLAALLLIVSAYLLRYDGKNAYRIWRRDRRNHKSPNSAQTESACAGALGLRLAGDAWYFGKLVPKPYIGDEIHPIEPQDIRRVNRLMYGAAGIMGLLALVMRAVILF